jgi:hypothetical protein
MSNPTLRQRIESGEVDRLYRELGEWQKVAARLGVSESALRRARQSCGGKPLPAMVSAPKPLSRPVRDENRSQPENLPDGDGIPIEWEIDDEKTEPHVAPRIESTEETITRVEEHRLKRRIRDLESELRDLTAQLSDGGEYHEVIAEVLAKQHEAPPPAIRPRERTSGLREATPLVLASDWHIEEEVRPEQVAGRNRYNLEIATRRMERFFESARWGIRHQREVFKIRDFIGWFGGDLITNFLHDDNIESNLLHPTEAILMAQTNIIEGIDHWLEDPEIEQFTFPLNDGNHGRLTDKTRAATRIENSLEVFLYAQLAMHYRNEPRVRFILPTSAFTFLDDVYGRTIRFTHGDTFKYGGGVGGMTVPMYRALARWESVKRADLTCMGHWHQRICLPNVMVNGSLIGFNPYAMAGGFAFEHPVQSMRMLDSLRWCSTDIPLWVGERSDDEQAVAA